MMALLNVGPTPVLVALLAIAGLVGLHLVMGFITAVVRTVRPPRTLEAQVEAQWRSERRTP